MPLPPFRRIAATLREQIEDGTLAVGDRVPSAAELARVHGVAESTANRSLALLARWGLTEGRVGVGTLVTQPPEDTDDGLADLEQAHALLGAWLRRHG